VRKCHCMWAITTIGCRVGRTGLRDEHREHNLKHVLHWNLSVGGAVELVGQAAEGDGGKAQAEIAERNIEIAGN